MHDHRRRRSADQETAPGRRKDDYYLPPSNQDRGSSVFPLFADPPFFTWQTLHRKREVFLHIHPSSQPLILLWDEVDDSEMLS